MTREEEIARLEEQEREALDIIDRAHKTLELIDAEFDRLGCRPEEAKATA